MMLPSKKNTTPDIPTIGDIPSVAEGTQTADMNAKNIVLTEMGTVNTTDIMAHALSTQWIALAWQNI